MCLGAQFTYVRCVPLRSHRVVHPAAFSQTPIGLLLDVLQQGLSAIHVEARAEGDEHGGVEDRDEDDRSQGVDMMDQDYNDDQGLGTDTMDQDDEGDAIEIDDDGA